MGLFKLRGSNPVFPTNKKPAAIAAGFVISGARRVYSPARIKGQNGPDFVGTGLLG